MNYNKIKNTVFVIFTILSLILINCSNTENKNKSPSKKTVSIKKETESVELPKCVSRKLVKSFGTFYSVIHNFGEVVKPNDIVIEIESSKSIMDNKTSYGCSISIFSKKRYNAFIPDNQYQAHILRTASESSTAKDYDIEPYIPESTNLYNCIWKHQLDVTEIESKKAMQDFINRGPVYCRIPGTQIEFKITDNNIENFNKLFSENWDIIK